MLVIVVRCGMNVVVIVVVILVKCRTQQLLWFVAAISKILFENSWYWLIINFHSTSCIPYKLNSFTRCSVIHAELDTQWDRFKVCLRSKHFMKTPGASVAKFNFLISTYDMLRYEYDNVCNWKLYLWILFTFLEASNCRDIEDKTKVWRKNCHVFEGGYVQTSFFSKNINFWAVCKKLLSDKYDIRNIEILT